MCLSKNLKPNPQVLGTGMARKAGDAIKNRPAYMQYVEETQANGEKPMSPEEWARTRGAGGS